MKIDYVCIGFYPIIGGTETVVLNIAKRMVKKGHDVIVHTSTYNPNFHGRLPNEDLIDGVRVLRYRLFPPFIFFPVIRETDIIHLFSFGDNFIIQSLLQDRDKLIVSPIGEEINSYQKFRIKVLGQHILNKAQRILASTIYESEFLISHYHISPDKIVISPFGVDENAFLAPKENDEKIEGRYYSRLARIDRVKKLDFGIRLLTKIDKQISHVIIGPCDDEKYLRELKDLAIELGVRDKVVFAGRVSEEEKRAILHHSLFHVVSNYENFGVSSIEAMAQGVPILAPDIEAYKGLFVNNLNSLLYTCDSLDDAAAKANEIIEDEELAHRLGEKAKEIAKAKFSWDSIVDEVEQVYYNVQKVQKI